MVTIFGIRNCDKCRAAIKWFEKKGTDFRFHDVRVDGLTASVLERWQKTVGDDALMNRRSPTWRAIPAAEKAGLNSAGNRKLMLANPTLIKRPVVEFNNRLVVGYDESGWKTLLANGSHKK